VTRRFLTWRGLDAFRAEAAEVRLDRRRLQAAGVQVGADYRLDYELRSGDGYEPISLWVRATTNAGGERSALLDGDHDVDLGFSPLLNSLPILRGRLHEGPGALEVEAAWVAVPSLEVRAARQRYEHVRRTDTGGAIVRFTSLDGDGYTADLEVDGDGIVAAYPGLAELAS
jgi:hypothetical protein